MSTATPSMTFAQFEEERKDLSITGICIFRSANMRKLGGPPYISVKFTTGEGNEIEVRGGDLEDTVRRALDAVRIAKAKEPAEK